MRLTEAAVRKKYERAVKRARKLLMKEMMLDGE
jgi:RNA polymerase sigma-70 factor (ECF subfamily)